MLPVAGSKIAACTKADCAAFDSLHGPACGSVAVSSYGVARPWAVNGFFGMMSVQFGFGGFGAAAAAAFGVGVAAGGPAGCTWAPWASVSGFTVGMGDCVCAGSGCTNPATSTAENPATRRTAR